jgi:hypothetical protein
VPIHRFFGANRLLSGFLGDFPVAHPVRCEENEEPTTEQAYNVARSREPQIRREFAECATPGSIPRHLRGRRAGIGRIDRGQSWFWVGE